VTNDSRLRIAVFIDFDNIEIGVKNTLGGSFDAGLVLEALKERGEVVSKMAYSDWQRAAGYSRQLTQHAIRMVQRNMTPGGDKNGADINLALDALEMAFTHPHINAFVIVGGDSDFISLVEKLKQYDKKVFVVGGKQFTSAIMQRNCHEFIAYENLIQTRRPSGGRGQQGSERASLDQVIPLVTRALEVISEREVSPQMGLLKSTLVQLDSTFSERSYGAGSFRDFVDKLEKIGVVKLHHGGKGGVLVELASGAAGVEPDHAGRTEPVVHPSAESDANGHAPRPDANRHAARAPEPPRDAAIPVAVIGDQADGVREFKNLLATATISRWPMYLRNVKQVIRQQSPTFDERAYGFSSLVDLLRAAQKDGLVRVERDRQGVLRIFHGAHAPAASAAHEAPAPLVETGTDESVDQAVNGVPATHDEPETMADFGLTAPVGAPADNGEMATIRPGRRRRSRPAAGQSRAPKPAAAGAGDRKPRPRRKSRA
jgi:uncharacterized LabA/DUF88 family protein